jgi:hypothetical protein
VGKEPLLECCKHQEIQDNHLSNAYMNAYDYLLSHLLMIYHHHQTWGRLVWQKRRFKTQIMLKKRGSGGDWGG